MAVESEKDVDIAKKSDIPASADGKSKEGSKKNKQGLLARIWHAIIGSGKDDFQSRLEKISKEEAITLARTRKRAQSSRRVKMNLIILTLALEVFAVGYAIMTARSIENWKKRAFHIFPMFAWPGLMITIYSAYARCINIWERKDRKTLERLRAERQSKIDELKEKTNYYMTQQLIQRYDTDPAAKAAAATVLASKLGAESGLKLQMEGDNNLQTATGKSDDAELTQSRGLRNRKQPNNQSNSVRSDSSHQHPDASALRQMKSELAEYSQPLYVSHYEPGQGGPYASSGGWLPRLAAMLVGEDPAQSYALICGNCHMHNGLTSKEDFPYVTYICPHCRAINGPRNRNATHGSGSNTPNLFSQSAVIDNNEALQSTGQSPREEIPDGCNISGSIRDREVHTPSVMEECSHTVVASEDQGS